MPSISMFYGIIVYMYFMEHNPPHIHVKYGEHEAAFLINDGKLIDGGFPRSQTKLVKAWIEIHRSELLANWELAREGNTMYQIEPLK